MKKKTHAFKRSCGAEVHHGSNLLVTYDDD